MTAVLQAPIDVLPKEPVDFLARYSAQKQKLSDEEKRKRIFETGYEPSLEWWQANQADYVQPQDDPLPAGFPEQSESPSVWDGKQLINQPEKWLYRFTPEDIDHINQAYDHFVSLSLHNNDISRETFPIPAGSALYNALEKTVKEIKTGLGFQVLRGLPVDSWSRSKQIIVYAGISAYISNRRIKQGQQNIVHLRDLTNLDEDKRPVITVKGQTSGNQVFHNDGAAGIVSLITLDVAETGGLSQLSSAGQTYNELAKNRRDILRELAKRDWKTKTFPNGKPLVYTLSEKEVIFSYSRRPFFGFYEASADVPPLPKEKHLALDAIHFTAEKFSIDLELEKGDLEYFNNYTVLHARTASTDSEQSHRHLIRLWLDNVDQAVPEELSEPFKRLNSGDARAWPLEAWDSVDPYEGLKDATVEESSSY